jgi:hypothetical protein
LAVNPYLLQVSEEEAMYVQCSAVWDSPAFEDDQIMRCDLDEGHEGSHHDPLYQRWWAVA